MTAECSYTSKVFSLALLKWNVFYVINPYCQARMIVEDSGEAKVCMLVLSTQSVKRDQELHEC